MPEQRFLLTIGYQAGPDPRIQRGADGYRDYFTPEELEKAAWSLLRSGTPACGLFHLDGTEGAAEIVESSIRREPEPWVLKAVDGTQVSVNCGDWLVGLLCDETAWGLYKSGRVAGVSPQGAAKRRRPAFPHSLAKEFVMAKSLASGDLDEDELTELYDAQVPRIDLVGKGANGMPFLLAKSANGTGGLFDADYVRGLIAKSDPTPQPQEAVTLSGSPAAVAELIRSVHGAPVRKAEPDSYEALVKAKYNADDLKQMAASGAAMEDESYPIGDKEDVTRAVRAVGRGTHNSHEAIRRHIISRAKSLGASSEIPDTWNSDGSLKKEIDMAVVTGDSDTGIDGMDPTVVLAQPDDEQPGDPMEPGSPAWEAIDAATARKWTSILVRAKNALGVMADREMLEAATADPDDAEAAWDLQDAQCAIDYVIDTLAGFAVGEQAEADLGGEAMDAIGKALAGFDTAPLDVIEGLAAVRKAGRVLSAANESAIRGAVESLQKVLASLPQAPTADDEGGRALAKTANEESDMPEPTTSAETTAASGQETAMGAQQPAPTPPAGAVVTEVEKADGEKQMVAVYDANGDLVGIVDAERITPVAGAKKTAPEEVGDDAGSDDTPAAEAPPTDLTPAPPAEVGTPADAVTDDAAMTKNTDTSDVSESTIEGLLKAALQDFGATQAQVLKAALDERDRARGEQIEELAKNTNETIQELRATNSAQAEQIAKQAEQIEALQNAPAVREVVRNGALPPEHLLRGQQNGAPAVDLAKAQERRAALYAAPTAAQQNQIAREMNVDAVAALQAIHAGQRQ